jgi:hypothetical protein
MFTWLAIALEANATARNRTGLDIFIIDFTRAPWW